MRSRTRLHRWGGEAARVPKDVSPEKPRTPHKKTRHDLRRAVNMRENPLYERLRHSLFWRFIFFFLFSFRALCRRLVVVLLFLQLFLLGVVLFFKFLQLLLLFLLNLRLLLLVVYRLYSLLFLDLLLLHFLSLHILLLAQIFELLQGELLGGGWIAVLLNEEGLSPREKVAGGWVEGTQILAKPQNMKLIATLLEGLGQRHPNAAPLVA